MEKENSRESLLKKIASHFTLTDKRLTSQCLFWIAIFLPVILSMALSIPIIFQKWQEIHFSFTSEGYDNFFKLFKLPLWTMSLSIPFTAIIVNAHRTTQTESQINETKRKNNYDSFFSHQKHYVEAFSKIEKLTLNFTIPDPEGYGEKPIEKSSFISSPYRLYVNVFKDSSHKHGVNHENIKIFTSTLQQSISNLDSYLRKEKENNNDDVDVLKNTYDIIKELDNINKLLCIKHEHRISTGTSTKFMASNQKEIVSLHTNIYRDEYLRGEIHAIMFIIEKFFSILACDTPKNRISEIAKNKPEFSGITQLKYFKEKTSNKELDSLHISIENYNEETDENMQIEKPGEREIRRIEKCISFNGITHD
ncbi:sugar ABC transporter permease [Dickeya zeae]|uniref:Sugar ABC transporter permease n=1 Tax=Dickeya zeae TaxID=204042 RepID=A0AAE7D018_9GAMM|nr:sugar ABC transporter permease [Dickeya zeae]QIZ52372.1 sugar ABC transporter permease [Dickeya zeae]